ncbi:SDR family NAD(P)-dependent oxidoreductase [Blastopirellula marina]|uniref:Glucose 1-dehydrogenase-like protein n=1 Tax=Blastopirellula marina DSM 3645 TaxID=314230 RepID=A4A1M1_9BACT|nr:SDR family NAD(P)-dependent oxidoreductase [Blastopirellula marina]EAQ77326.1 glucose 1-dehydrogenase-like protein [Blastopirellula marina DSM 3645]
MARRQLRDQRAIVTGASSGIGRELTRQLLAAGAKVVATARREDRLQELAAEVAAPQQLVIVPGDICDGALRTALVSAADEHFGGLDLLINNAGIGALGPFADGSPERLRQVMEVNFFAPVELIRAALPALRRGRSPAICNISSILAHRAVPAKSEYCASKFAIHGFSDALRSELASEGIDVILVSPSTTESEFSSAVIEKSGRQPAKGKGAMTSADVAKSAIKAVQSGKHEVILSLGGKGLVWLDRLAPTWADWLVTRFGFDGSAGRQSKKS